MPRQVLSEVKFQIVDFYLPVNEKGSGTSGGSKTSNMLSFFLIQLWAAYLRVCYLLPNIIISCEQTVMTD